MVSLLLSKGAYVNVQDKLGRTSAMIAAELGNDAVLSLLIENDADMALRDKEGQGETFHLFSLHLGLQSGSWSSWVGSGPRAAGLIEISCLDVQLMNTSSMSV